MLIDRLLARKGLSSTTDTSGQPLMVLRHEDLLEISALGLKWQLGVVFSLLATYISFIIWSGTKARQNS